MQGEIRMNQRDKMMALLGQLEAIKFPLCWNEGNGQPYYDLIDSIAEQYKSILKMVYPDFKDEE